jgi:hypothetical protein
MPGYLWFLAALFAVVVLILASCASAPPPATAMKDGAFVQPPPQWLEYCRRPDTKDPACPKNP